MKQPSKVAPKFKKSKISPHHTYTQCFVTSQEGCFCIRFAGISPYLARFLDVRDTKNKRQVRSRLGPPPPSPRLSSLCHRSPEIGACPALVAIVVHQRKLIL